MPSPISPGGFRVLLLHAPGADGLRGLSADFSPHTLSWPDTRPPLAEIEHAPADAIVICADEPYLEACVAIAAIRPDVPVIVVTSEPVDGRALVRSGVEDVTPRGEISAAALSGTIRQAIARRARQHARERGATFRQVAQLMPVSICILRRRRIVYVNPATEDLSGYLASELLGRSPIDLLTEPFRQTAAEMGRGRARGEPVPSRGEWCIRTKDGSERWIDLTTAPIPFEGGPATVSIAFDVTERRELARRMRQQHQLEAIGRLAGGIAHNFNNLLLVVTADVEQLLDELPAETPLGSGARRIATNVDRVADLTRDLLAFARRDTLVERTIAMGELVTHAAAALIESIDRAIEVRAYVAERLPPIHADGARLQRAMVLIGTHAAERMPAGGQVNYIADLVTVDAAWLQRKPWLQGGRWVRIRVADNGERIPSDALPHVFEPYFTTGRFGASRGLTLSTAYGTIKQCGGYIWVDNEEAGTVVTVLLPVAQSSDVGAEPAATAAPATARILMVEDEGDVRDVLSATLRRAGYTVRTAATAEAAAQLAAAESFDLLITDVVLPGMTGVELAHGLRIAHPGLRTLFMSGYPGDATLDDIDRRFFLEKPFSTKEFLRRIAEALAS